MEKAPRPPMKGRSIGQEWLFIPIAKNAHRSIVRSILDSDIDCGIVYWNSVPAHLKSIVMMREPLDRLRSTYRMFREKWGTHFDNPSFNHFVSTLLNRGSINHPAYNVEYDDLHLRTQWESMGSKLPHTLVKWDFDKFCSLVGIDHIPHIGQSGDVDKEELSPYNKALFENYYRKDLEIWNSNAH